MTPPNVLLLTVDCLRYDRCGWNGYDRPTTPVLDSLAEEASVFDAAFASGPRTNESFPGILAGRLSADAPYFDEIQHKALDSPTIAGQLRAHGYTTEAVITNAQLSPMKQYDAGFDRFRNLRIEETGDKFRPDATSEKADGPPSRLSRLKRHLLHDELRDRLRGGRFDRWNAYMLPFVAYRRYQERTEWPTVAGSVVADELGSAIDRLESPFFLWGHFNDLHAPIHPERARHPDLCDATSLEQFLWDARRLGDVAEPNYGAMYDGALRYVDRQIGRVLDALDEAGLRDETVVVVTADHGEALFDRGVYGHATGHGQFALDDRRCYIYDELLHVPLLVDVPDADGGRSAAPTSLAWLHEIIAEATGLDLGEFPRQSGRASHLRADGTAPDGEVVIADVLDEGHTMAVRDGRFKLITEAAGSARGSLDGSMLVFDTEQDPDERVPLQPSPAVAQLEATARDVFTHPDDLRSIEGTVDPETVELLEQIGYR